MKDKILVIEDDTEINKMLCLLLEKNGYEAVSAYSGTEGVLVHDTDVVLILLDLMLPGKSGEEIITQLKEKKDVPVIVISAIHDVDKKVDLFSLGADDYITKPFHNKELLVRIKARLKSRVESDYNNILKYRDIEINKQDFRVKCNGEDVILSKHEFELLRTLMEKPEMTYTKSMLFDKVWDDENSADDNTLNVHISKIRKKLKECNPESEYIETVWGIGYRMKRD